MGVLVCGVVVLALVCQSLDGATNSLHRFKRCSLHFPLDSDVVFGDVVFGDVVFGDVVFGDVVFDVVFVDVVFGDVVFGDVVFGDVVFGDVVFGDVVFGNVVFGNVVFGNVVFGNVVFGGVWYRESASSEPNDCTTRTRQPMVLSKSGNFSLDVRMPGVSPTTSDTYLCVAVPVPTTRDAYIGEYSLPKS
ncbi:unnamed protein product [Coregonus sp. 'balchen']|nr:unnamed protein product [Coregonus sp. 'balchen']